MTKRALSILLAILMLLGTLPMAYAEGEPEPAALTQGPSPAQEPVVTEEPAATEEPAVTEVPVTTEEPIATEEPVFTEEPVVTEEPAVTEEPVVTEEPAVTEKPVVTEEPIVTEKPVATEEPAVTPEPEEADLTAQAQAPTKDDNTGVCGDQGENVKWSFSGGVLTITGAGRMADFDSAGQPWHDFMGQIKSVVVNRGVTRIGANAFYGHKALTSATISNTVASIGDSAFYGAGLTAINLPAGVMELGRCAFAFCASAASLNISAGALSTIGEQAFCGSGMASVTIPNTVTTIGRQAFAACPNLKTVTLGSRVRTVEREAFFGSALTSVTIPAGVTSIGTNAFGCPNLTAFDVDENSQSYASVDGVLFNHAKTKLLAYPRARSGAYTIPGKVTTVAYPGFAGAEKLTAVTMPSSLKTIQTASFSRTGLTKLTIPEGVTSIGEAAFALTKLTAVTVENPQCVIGKVNWDAEDTPLAYPTGSALGRSKTSSQWQGAGGQSGVTTVSGYNGSTAQAYAAEHGYNFKNLGKAPVKLAAPKLKSVSGTSTGVKITWGAVKGAAKYRVYYKTSKSGWTKIKDVTGTSYTWTGAKVGTKYTFTVKAFDSNSRGGNYDASGKSITFYKLKPPAAPKVSNTTTGVKITWTAVSGAAKYRVFYKTGSGKWTKIGDTTKTSYTWKKAQSGTKYSFTIRCVTKDGKSYTSAYNTKGTSITYIAAPKISKVQNTTSGVKITWGAVTGAGSYRLFYKIGSGKWTKIGDTTKTSYTWKKAKSGTKYSFTIRCVTKDGKSYTSAYNTKGSSITYIAAPKLSKAAKTPGGIKITWGKAAGAVKYRVFYKIGDGKWTRIGDTTKTSYTWKKAKSGTTYSFTVRCVSKAGKSYTSAYDPKGVSITYKK